MGLFEPARLLLKRLCSTCPVESSSPSPSPQEKKSTAHPKRLLIMTSPHQCDTPGIDPMINSHLRINCADPGEDSCPGRITVRVLETSRTRLSKLFCHCTDTPSVAFPQTNATVTRARTMGQRYPLIRPGPGDNPSIQPPFLAPARRGLPEDRIPKSPLFFSFSHFI